MTSLVTLDQAKTGELLTVKRILNPEIAAQAMRLGLSEGQCLQVACKIPGGPVVVRRGSMEIALGRELCQGIEVEMA